MGRALCDGPDPALKTRLDDATVEKDDATVEKVVSSKSQDELQSHAEQATDVYFSLLRASHRVYFSYVEQAAACPSVT